MAPCPLLLSSTTQSQNLLVDLAPWLLLLAGFVLIGVLLTGQLRKRLIQKHPQTPSLSFTLQDLKMMRDTGQLSDEEFERAAARLTQHMTKTPPQEDASSDPD